MKMIDSLLGPVCDPYTVWVTLLDFFLHISPEKDTKNGFWEKCRKEQDK